MKRILHYILISLSLLSLSACTDAGSDINGMPSNDAGVEATYSGTWWVNDKQSQTTDVMVHGAAFFFSQMPYKDILTQLLPGKTVGEIEDEGYVVPFVVKAYNDRTYLYILQPTEWNFSATIDGKKCGVGIIFSPIYNVDNGSWGSYSRQTGVFTLFLRAASFKCTGLSDSDADAAPVDLRLKFTSTTPKK